ncbi:hypothetical protein KKH35_01455, partial [Patescibacteria group bacterium]|nr:hypothetical protein [Patescibacteria group bacterium]
MQIKNKKQIISISLSVIVSVFLVSLAVYAATTIGSNITTGGTLSVTGDASFSTASTTGNFWLGNQTADDDDFLYMDASSTEYLMWDDSPGQFQLSDDLQMTGSASTTEYISIGGDAADDNDILYFDAQNANLTWDNDPGLFTMNQSLQMTGSASTTEYISIGGDVDDDDDILYFDARNENITWDNTASQF